MTEAWDLDVRERERKLQNGMKGLQGHGASLTRVTSFFCTMLLLTGLKSAALSHLSTSRLSAFFLSFPSNTHISLTVCFICCIYSSQNSKIRSALDDIPPDALEVVMLSRSERREGRKGNACITIIMVPWRFRRIRRKWRKRARSGERGPSL